MNKRAPNGSISDGDGDVKIESAMGEDDRDGGAQDNDQGVWQREEEAPPASSDSGGVMSVEVELNKRVFWPGGALEVSMLLPP